MNNWPSSAFFAQGVVADKNNKIKRLQREHNRLKRASLELASTLDHYLNTGNESRDNLRTAIVNFEEATGLRVEE